MTLSKSPEKIRSLFNGIAEKYDFMNNLISLGLHRKIKKISAETLDIKPHSKVLDACCGTGDMADIIKKIQPLADVTGCDFSEKMLEIAKAKIYNVKFIYSDVSNLEFSDNNFDFVTMAFGLRNIANPEKVLNEIYRVLIPGGEFLHLMFYGNKSPYEYLVKSKRVFPEPDELIEDFEKCGFKFKKKKDFLCGAISVQIMKK